MNFFRSLKATHLSLLICLTLSLAAGCSWHTSFENPKPFVIDDRWTLTGNQGIDFHLLTYPESVVSQKYPLIFVLHGSGVDSKKYINDWSSEAVRHHFMVLAPTLPSGELPDPEQWKLLIDYILQKYPVDPGRMYIAGASRGAFWGRVMLGLTPHFWRGAVFVAGPGDTDWWQKADLKELPPLLFVQGERDDLSSIVRIRGLIAFLKEKGFDVSLISDPEAAHTHNPKWNASIFDWMESKENKR